MKEEWKEIDGWPDYMVSNIGRVFSYRRKRTLKNSSDLYGYPCVHLCYNNCWSRRSVHRLVAFAFVDGYFEGAIVNHIDGIKQNCVASNLEWITQSDNVQHALALGLSPRKVRVIETGDMFRSPSSCARHINGNLDAILKCLNGEQQSHKGYTFEYIHKN